MQKTAVVTVVLAVITGCALPTAAQNPCTEHPRWLVVTVERVGIADPGNEDSTFSPFEPTWLTPNQPDGRLFTSGRQAIPACQVAEIEQWGSGARLSLPLDSGTGRFWKMLFVRESVDAVCAALSCAATGPPK